MILQTHDALVLDDGTRLRLRPIDFRDRDGIALLFARLSPQSRYQRFLSPKRELTTRELSYFTDVDQRRHVAIAAIDESDGSIVAVCRYVQSADRAGVADMAIVVVDDFQRMGVGTGLAAHTVRRAGANGVAILTATTLRENGGARALLRNLSFNVHASNGHELEHVLQLSRTPQPAASSGERKAA